MQLTTKEVLKKIGDFGLSDPEIARRVGSSQPTIFRLRTGKSKDCMSNLRKALDDLLLWLSKDHELAGEA